MDSDDDDKQQEALDQSDTELVSRKVSHQTENDPDSLSPNEENSFDQRVSDNRKEIPERPSASSQDHSQVDKLNHTFETGNRAYEQDSNEVISAVSQNISEDVSTRDKQDAIECSEIEPESGTASLKMITDLSAIEGNSTHQIISDNYSEISGSSSTSSEGLGIPLPGSNEIGSNQILDRETSSPGAYQIPGRCSDRGSDRIIDAVSNIITADPIIDNAFLVNDDDMPNTDEKEKIFFYISIFATVIVVVSSTLITLYFTAIPKTTPETTKNETVQSDKIPIDTSVTIDDFKNMIIESGISTKENIMNASSPQSKALHWMTNEKISMLLLKDMMIESLIQRYVSVVFYYSLNGGNWTNHYSFLTEGLSECMWGNNDLRVTSNDGITCHKNGTISRINIEKNNLSGTIPIEVGYLKSMMRLNLMDNDISGTIPSSIQNIDTLYVLDLSLNSLTGTIPISLANISNLEVIAVTNENLVGFEEFCPLLEGKNVTMQAHCNISNLLDKAKCDEYTRLHCCQTLEGDVWQCCHSNPIAHWQKCYNPDIRPLFWSQQFNRH